MYMDNTKRSPSYEKRAYDRGGPCDRCYSYFCQNVAIEFKRLTCEFVVPEISDISRLLVIYH